MTVRTVKTRWRDVALVCRKCSKKLDGGFGADGRQSLRKALRRELGAGKGRKAEIVVKEVDCFDICPKNAVVAVNAAAPRDLLIIPRGTPVERAAAALGLVSDARDGVTEADHGSRPVG